MKTKQQVMSKKEKQQLKDEMIVLEKLLLLRTLDNGHKLFKKIKTDDVEFLISKN